jgi:hypothetical protein
MTRTVHHAFHTSTDIIEHALLHARQETWHCDLCDKKGHIGRVELELALESRLVNAHALIDATYDPDESTAPMRTISTLVCLIREALQLCALTYWADKKSRFPFPQVEPNQQPLNEALRSIANRSAAEAMHGA